MEQFIPRKNPQEASSPNLVNLIFPQPCQVLAFDFTLEISAHNAQVLNGKLKVDDKSIERSRAKNQFHMSLLQLFSDLAPGIPPSVNESAEFHFIIEKTAKGLHGEFGYCL